MNHLLTALLRSILLSLFFILFLASEKAVSQSCINWLSTPSVGSFVTVGDLDVTGNKLTVEAVFNRSSAFDNSFSFGKLVSKHTDETNVNYSLLPVQCEITTSVTGYVATPQVCLPELDKTYHVAMVYDGTTLKFYRDGFLMTQTPCTGNLVNNNLLTTIGQIADPAHPLSTQFLGFINEVRIWKVARTQAQLRTYMHSSLPAAVQTGLVGYYTFNNLLNKQGTVAFNGTLNGAAKINQTNTNCAFVPDSCGVPLSLSCSNWLNVPSQPSWVNIGDLDVAGNKLTVEALINIKGIPPGGVIQGLDVVSKHTGPANVNYLLRSSHAELSTTNGYFYTPDGCDLEMNKTYHVAMVYDGVSLKYYRNGFLLGETPATGNMIQSDLPTGIGFISTLMQAENFIGFINEVRIWNVARTQNQIRANMDISLANPATQAGLLAYYTFDNLLNKQGNAAWNGTLVGAASINQTNPECDFIPTFCDIIVDPPPTTGCGGFQLALGGQAYDRAFDVAATTNNEFYVAGVSQSFSASDDILVSRLTSAGAVVWSKTFGNNGVELVRKITATADGGLLIAGQTKSFANANGDILCMKVNSTGGLVWSKVLGVGSPNGDLGMEIIETSDGGYAVSGILNVNGTVADAVVMKLNNAANVVWSKRFDRGDGENGVGIFQKQDTLIVSIDLQNTIYHYETIMMKLKLADGTFIMSKKLTPAARGLYNPYILKDPLQPGYIVSLHTIDNSSYANMNHTILNLDEDFNIRKSRLIAVNPVTNDFYTGLAVLPDGSFIGTSTNQTNGNGVIYRINDDNSGVFIKRFNAATARRLFRVAVSGQQLMAVGGAIDNGQEDFFITSFDINGGLGASCDVEDIALTIQQPGYTVSPFTWPTINDVNFPASPAVLNTANAPLQNKDLCPVSRPDFSIKQDPCNPKTIQIETNLTNIQNYEWDFGDGQTNTGNPNPLVTYADFGTYTIKLKTQNTAGCVDSIEKQISVNVIVDSLIITNDTTICYGTTKQLKTSSALNFCWSPTTYLDNPNSPNPVTSATQDITYYFTAEVTGANLITNGNFSQGNTGFTSGYNFASSNTTEGQYFVGANPKNWNNSLSACKDHTSGNGNMMLVNGSPAADMNVWKQTVNVTPNTNYAFSTWIQALWSPNPAQLQFSINGNDAGSLLTASLPTCTWTQFYTTWNSGNNTTAVISIVNKNILVQGNDFALDDISFAPVFIKRDSVKIKVEKPFVQTNSDTSFCPGSSVQFNTTGAQNYSWSPTAGLSNTGVADPVASPAISTAYIVTGTTANGCLAKDTVNVNIYPKPVITLSDDTTICKNALAQLSVTGGTGYSWSPAATLNDPLVANPVASPVVNTKYYVAITDANTCEHLDSIEVFIKPDAVFSISDPGKVCRNDSLQLNASGGDVYNWQPVEGISNTGIFNPKVSPSVTTDYTVTITETTCNQSATLSTKLTVMPLPVVNAAKSNDIDCSNDRSQLIASGADQYVWSPATTLSNPAISNPVATPVSGTEYIVKGTDIAGCNGYDTITVKVDNANKGGYLMPNAFTPNNDGLNDCFRIKYWGVINGLEFSIYNRWGERIFFTRDAGQCWDGTYKGVQQDGGVYVYMIKASSTCDADVFRKGIFVLVR